MVFDFGSNHLVGGSIERGDAGQFHPADLALISPMHANQVLLVEPRGFCAGVEMAIKALALMVLRLGLPSIACTTSSTTTASSPGSDDSASASSTESSSFRPAYRCCSAPRHCPGRPRGGSRPRLGADRQRLPARHQGPSRTRRPSPRRLRHRVRRPRWPRRVERRPRRGAGPDPSRHRCRRRRPPAEDRPAGRRPGPDHAGGRRVDRSGRGRPPALRPRVDGPPQGHLLRHVEPPAGAPRRGRSRRRRDRRRVSVVGQHRGPRARGPAGGRRPRPARRRRPRAPGRRQGRDRRRDGRHVRTRGRRVRGRPSPPPCHRRADGTARRAHPLPASGRPASPPRRRRRGAALLALERELSAAELLARVEATITARAA